MLKITVLLLAAALAAFAVDPTGSTQVPVAINHEKGSFRGTLHISTTGPKKKANVRWNGQIQNTSEQTIYHAKFCVKAYSRHGAEQPYGCLLRLWGDQWAGGDFRSFQGKDKVQIVAKSKDEVQIHRYEVQIEEILDRAPNLRLIEARCPLVWNPAIQAFADKDFHPKVVDKDSFTGSFDYAGGLVNDAYRAKQHLQSFTRANTRLFGPKWAAFRVDNASVYLRNGEPGTCEAEIRMSYAGYGKPLMQNYYSWYKVESNFAFEKAALNEIEKLALRAQETDMDRAIRQLPTHAEASFLSSELVSLTVTSEPSGAEIEINDEWVGSTPTTVNVAAGRKILRVKRSGRQTWERSFNTNPGDKRTVHVELATEP